MSKLPETAKQWSHDTSVPTEYSGFVQDYFSASHTGTPESILIALESWPEQDCYADNIAVAQLLDAIAFVDHPPLAR